MRRRVIVVCALAAVLAATLAASGQAQVAHPVVQVLGRRLVTYSAGTAHWQASAQVQYVDTNGNGVADAENGRCAVLEQAGLSRVRVTTCIYQQQVDTNGDSIPDTWVNRMINDSDAVGASFARLLTPTAAFCTANPALLRWSRVRNFHVVRRASDGALFYRSPLSNQVQARAFAFDPGCKPSADLSVAKTAVDIQDPEGGDDVGPIAAVDDTFLYRITVSNPAGGATATDVDVADDYPADLDPPQPGNRCAIDVNAGGEQNVVCSITYIEPGRSHTFTIVARTNGTTGASVEENIASLVELDQPDPNLANNSDSVTVTTG
jgi:Domain of unknown function DUF11